MKKRFVFLYIACSEFEECSEYLSLPGEAVDDIVIVIGDWGFEEEAEI